MGQVSSIRRGVLAAFLVSLPALALAAPDLAGRWERNGDMSQDVARKLDVALGAPARDAEEAERQKLRERLLRLARGAQVFEVEQTAKEFKVAAGDAERVRIFYPDGAEHRRDSSEGLKIKVVSKWEGEAFVVSQDIEDGDHIQERFERDGERLVHVLRWTSKRLRAPLEVRTVYDRGTTP